MATALPPSSTDRPAADAIYRKPRADLYTLMLIIALVAVLVGILFLVFENQTDYEWKMKDSIDFGMIAGSRVTAWFAGFFG
jgi:hypothetical protein